MQKLRFLLLIVLLLNLSSCKWLYPNFLLRDTKDYVYYELMEAEEQKQVILPDDRISFGLYTRDGYGLIDVLGTGESGGMMSESVEQTGFIVMQNGYVELPVLGEVYVQGLTRLQLENLLEEKYSFLYNDPFVQLHVTNRRVYIFAGVGNARVLSLPAENTKLIEVIALVGGIPDRAKSHKIRIIRGDYENPSIKKIDLSTIAGLKDADFIVQPNDLIIIDSQIRPGERFISEINRIMTLVTAVTTIYLLVLSITRQ